MTHVGGGFFVVALLVLFVETGSFAFDALSRLGPTSRAVVFGCLMLAAWAKSAQVPAHTWLPDAMAAPTPVSAYLHAAAMVKAGVYLMARAASSGWAMPHGLAIVLAVLAVATMFVALSYYFVQDDLKRLLAYSTIAHLGYVLVGVALGAMGITVGFQGGVLHIICHGFGKATLFLCAGAVAYVTGTRSISALGGLARTMPLTAAAFFVGVLAVTGIPPFASFWSKFMLLAGALELPGLAGPILLVLLLVESFTAFAWMLYVGQRVFLGVTTPAAAVHSDPPLSMSITLVVLMIGCLLAPAVGLPLVELIGP
jgi:hydrogenase-4 component D